MKITKLQELTIMQTSNRRCLYACKSLKIYLITCISSFLSKFYLFNQAYYRYYVLESLSVVQTKVFTYTVVKLYSESER